MTFLKGCLFALKASHFVVFAESLNLGNIKQHMFTIPKKDKIHKSHFILKYHMTASPQLPHAMDSHQPRSQF